MNNGKQAGRIISLQKPSLTFTNRRPLTLTQHLADSDKDSITEDSRSEYSSEEDSSSPETPEKPKRKPGSPPRKAKKEILQTVDSLMKPEKEKKKSKKEREQEEHDEYNDIPTTKIKPTITPINRIQPQQKEATVSIKLDGARILDASYSDENVLTIKLGL